MPPANVCQAQIKVCQALLSCEFESQRNSAWHLVNHARPSKRACGGAPAGNPKGFDLVGREGMRPMTTTAQKGLSSLAAFRGIGWV